MNVARIAKTVLVAGVAAASTACSSEQRSGTAAPSRSETTQTAESTKVSDVPDAGPRAELVAAVNAYVRARNGTDLEAYRSSICRSVRDIPSAAARPPAIDVAVDRIGEIRINGQSATVTVDLRYFVEQAGPTQTIGPYRGIEWVFAREEGAWRQCSPPAFSSVGHG